MKVSDIKALIPLAEVYELNPDSKYIITVLAETPNQVVHSLINAGRELKLQGVFAMVTDHKQIKFYAIE